MRERVEKVDILCWTLLIKITMSGIPFSGMSLIYDYVIFLSCDLSSV